MTRMPKIRSEGELLAIMKMFRAFLDRCAIPDDLAGTCTRCAYAGNIIRWAEQINKRCAHLSRAVTPLFTFCCIPAPHAQSAVESIRDVARFEVSR